MIFVYKKKQQHNQGQNEADKYGSVKGLPLLTRACFKENSSLHISSAKARLQNLSDLFYQKVSIFPAIFPNDLILSLHKQPFITANFDSSQHVKTSPAVYN